MHCLALKKYILLVSVLRAKSPFTFLDRIQENRRWHTIVEKASYKQSHSIEGKGIDSHIIVSDLFTNE